MAALQSKPAGNSNKRHVLVRTVVETSKVSFFYRDFENNMQLDVSLTFQNFNVGTFSAKGNCSQCNNLKNLRGGKGLKFHSECKMP